MPKPGQYREILTPGLIKIREYTMAASVVEQDLKLAISSSIRGPVEVKKNLTDMFIDAMETMRETFPDLAEHYVGGLKDGSIVPVINNCAEINERIGDRAYAPGELFFAT